MQTNIACGGGCMVAGAIIVGSAVGGAAGYCIHGGDHC